MWFSVISMGWKKQWFLKTKQKYFFTMVFMLLGFLGFLKVLM